MPTSTIWPHPEPGPGNEVGNDYAAGPALPMLLVPAADLAALRSLWPANLPLVSVHDAPHGFALDQGKGPQDLQSPPVLPLAMLATSPAGLALMERFAGWVADRTGEAPPRPCLVTGAPTLIPALAGLAEAAMAKLCSQAGLAVTALRSLAELRRVREDQQQRLTALEDFITASNRQPHELAFAEAQDPESTQLELGGRDRPLSVSQLLPVPSLGVSAIALHLGQPSLTDIAELTVTLETVEDGMEHATWRVPPESQGAGWIMLGLERGIPGLRRTLRLVLRVPRFQGTALLSLGSPQPLPMFRVCGEGGAPLAPASLAFQVWTGLPGVPPPPDAVDCLPEGVTPPAAPPTAAAPPAAAPVLLSPPLTLPTEEPAFGTGAQFGQVRLDELHEDPTYRHLDLSVLSLGAGPHDWPHVKFKVSEMRGVHALEFRRGAGWPEMFEEFPEAEVDAFSEVWRLRDISRAGPVVERLPAAADRALLQALLELLPELIETLGVQGDLSPEAATAWRDAVFRKTRTPPPG